MAPGTGSLCQILRRDGGTGIFVRFDRVNPVAICTNRCLTIAVRDRLSMNALAKFLLHRGMAFRAGSGNVEFEDGGFGIRRGEDFVRPMTVRADGGFFHAVGDRFPMDAFPISGEGLCAASYVHHELLIVAGAASGRNIGMVGARFHITRT